MALITQIRLPSITGSMGTSSGPWPGDVQEANLNANDPLDKISSEGVSAILQRFADAVGKISGFSDWTDSQQGAIVSMPGGDARDLMFMQMASQKLELQSSGSFTIKKVGQGGALTIRTGDGGPATAPSGQIQILSQQHLILSSAQANDGAINLMANQGGISGTAWSNIKFHSADGGVELLASGSGNGIKIASSTPNSSIMLSASLGFPADIEQGTSSTVDLVSKRGLAFYSSGSHNAGSMSSWGLVGPQLLPGGQDSWFQVTGVGQSVRIGAESHPYGGGKLYLSASRNVYFSDQGSAGAGVDQGFGNGSWRMSKPGEFATFVGGFGAGETLVGALNALAGGIAGTEPSLFGLQVQNVESPNAQVTLNHRAGSPPNLANYKTNTVQVMLNGQLLLSASGPVGTHGSAVQADGDYYIQGDGTNNRIHFGFALEIDDQIQVWDLA